MREGGTDAVASGEEDLLRTAARGVGESSQVLRQPGSVFVDHLACTALHRFSAAGLDDHPALLRHLLALQAFAEDW